VAVLRLHAASTGHVTKASYSYVRGVYVRWGTKCRKLRTPCLQLGMFCTSPSRSERVPPPPSLLARRTTSGAGIPRSRLCQMTSLWFAIWPFFEGLPHMAFN
jgi:hypothetical protein